MRGQGNLALPDIRGQGMRSASLGGLPLPQEGQSRPRRHVVAEPTPREEVDSDVSVQVRTLP
jgi:hypothetical protein